MAGMKTIERNFNTNLRSGNSRKAISPKFRDTKKTGYSLFIVGLYIDYADCPVNSKNLLRTKKKDCVLEVQNV